MGFLDDSLGSGPEGVVGDALRRTGDGDIRAIVLTSMWSKTKRGCITVGPTTTNSTLSSVIGDMPIFYIVFKRKKES